MKDWTCTDILSPFLRLFPSSSRFILLLPTPSATESGVKRRMTEGEESGEKGGYDRNGKAKIHSPTEAEKDRGIKL